MRGTRWLILVAIVLLLGGVAATYRLQKKELRDEAPPKPDSMAPELMSAAQDWVHIETSEPPDSRTICRITAKDVRQAKDSNHVELEQVELRLPSMHTDTYNLVHSAHAEYHQADKRLYSDGAVDITLAVPNEGQPKHTLVSIHSSGVTFDSGTGKANTDRPATFRFENGEGSAVGASYDPSTRELLLNSQAELHWDPPGPNAKPMKIEAGQVIYRENLAGIWLLPWSRLTRGNTMVEAGETVIALEDGRIHHVDAKNAHGTDAYPSRKLQYAADHLTVDYDDTGEVQGIVGEGHARLVSESEGSQITATGDRVDLQFEDYKGESALALALVNGHGLLESKPLGHAPAETRIMRSEIIQMKMRPGGREIAGLETHAPSELEFLPNLPIQRHRKFTGERMWITYGTQNRIQAFSAVNCKTVSDPTPDELAKKRPAATTVSKNVSAAFDPKNSQLTRMEQWGDFSYEAGDRKARADRGILEQVENRITLDQHAHMWDSTGNTTADRIVLDEKSGNFTAEGHVNTSRMPDQQKKKSDSGMLSGDEPLQAVARSMSSANHNKLVKYDGNAVLWQGVNRIQADHVEIDRDKRSITADGHVVTQSREENKAGETAPAEARATTGTQAEAPATPVFTLVKAPHLVYTDADRVAHYSGGVLLNRAGLQMKAADLRSWLAEEGADNRLQKAEADGAVEIVQAGPVRTRTGTSEHAEYYTDEEKIVLRGGNPTMNDSLRGSTRGTELTYYSDDDRLLVKGSDAKPAISRIRKKHPQ